MAARRKAIDVAVVGAGAFGLSIALRIARAGLAVRVFDKPDGGRPNASAVAAGMLAPVSETLAEGGDREHLSRLLIARDLWPAFAQSVVGLVLDRTGTDLLAGDAAALNAIIALLSGWGMKSPQLSPYSPSSPRPASPLAAVRKARLGVHLAEDWRLDPIAAIAALRSALADLGVEVEAKAVELGHRSSGIAARGAPADLWIEGEPLSAQRVVIAAGWGAHALAPVAPELGVLSPIKGQLAAFAPGGPYGPALRGEGFYLVPQASGARYGATMQPGRDDLAIDAAVLARQRAAAVALEPILETLAFRGEAGVRAATPDGWPLVGASASPGVFLAAGARRNGWLLAPLVSQMIADAVTGGPPHVLAQAFHPGRFTR